MGIQRRMEWPEPRSLTSIEEVSEYCTLIYKALTEESALRLGDISTQFQYTTTENIGGAGVSTLPTAKIDDAAITAAKIAALAVEEAKIAADAVTATKIAVSGLDGTSGDVAANHIIAGMIQTNAITSVKILADAVTATKIDVVGLNGATGRIVVTDQTDADVVTAGINTHAVTLINAGKILISGAVPLSDWSHATDATLIDGGEIYTNSITAAQIAAGAITAEKLSIASITDNMVLNPSFEHEGGWGLIEGTGTITYSTADKTEGSYSLLLPAPTTAWGCLAIPLVPGDKYTVRIKIKGTSATGSGLYLYMNEKTSYPSGGYVTSTLRDIVYVFIDNGAIPSTWTTYEYTYTVSANMYWGSLSIYNWTGGAASGVYIDEAEVRKQLAGVHIEDGVITAAKITAGTITADEIFANTITVGEIKAGTILLEMYTDFFSTANDSNDPWVGAALGAGSSSSVAGTANHPGIVRFSSVATAGTGYRFMTSLNPFLMGGAEHSEFCFKTPASLTDVAARLGYQDSATDGNPTDGVYINILETTLSGKTWNNGAGSTTGTTYTIAVNTWYRAEIAINSDATLVTYILYNAAGTVLWTNTLATNIPTATGRETGHGVVAWIRANTAQALIDLDMMIATHSGVLTR